MYLLVDPDFFFVLIYKLNSRESHFVNQGSTLTFRLPPSLRSLPSTLRMHDKHNLLCFVRSSRCLHQMNAAPYESYRREQRWLHRGGSAQPWEYQREWQAAISTQELQAEKPTALLESLSTHKHLLKGHPANGLLDTFFTTRPPLSRCVSGTVALMLSNKIVTGNTFADKSITLPSHVLAALFLCRTPVKG